MKAIRSEEEARISYEKEETDSVMAVLGNVIIESAGTEEEAEEGIEDALTMDIEEAGKNLGSGL